jgi:hypothetical protein
VGVGARGWRGRSRGEVDERIHTERCLWAVAVLQPSPGLCAAGDHEFAGFARINAIARVHKFGSEEYKASMQQEKATINLHFSRNSHHPERPKLIGEAAESTRGLADDATYWSAHTEARMTFLDVIEMVCDWWGARKGYDD